MGEFLAWAATGIVTGLQTWSAPGGSAARNDRRNRRSKPAQNGSLSYRQRFFLRQRDGRDIEILLIDSGIPFQNGHAVTAVWAARASAPYGHCIYLENHTNGAIARLAENVSLIRKPARFWKIAVSGFLVTCPAALALLGWLVWQRGLTYMYERTFIISAVIAMVLLFVIGVVVAKIVFDYLRAEDDQKIWHAADKALLNARRVLIQRPLMGRPK